MASSVMDGSTSGLNLLESRLQSTIPTPVAKYGRTAIRQQQPIVVYDGTPITFFLRRQGADWRQYRDFLRENQIGRVFDGLTSGTIVVVKRVTD